MSEKQDTGGSVWFTSPVVAAVSAALFGLLGTGFGVVLQGYWTMRLEHQKFESSMIQQALESPDRKEAARRLVFLIKSGIVTKLNTTVITDLANDPDNLPLVQPTGFRDALGELLTPEREPSETDADYGKRMEEWLKKAGKRLEDARSKLGTERHDD